MTSNLLNHLRPTTLVTLAVELLQNHGQPMKRGWNFHTEDAAAAYTELLDAGYKKMAPDAFIALIDDALAAEWDAYSDELHNC